MEDFVRDMIIGIVIITVVFSILKIIFIDSGEDEFQKGGKKILSRTIIKEVGDRKVNPIVFDADQQAAQEADGKLDSVIPKETEDKNDAQVLSTVPEEGLQKGTG